MKVKKKLGKAELLKVLKSGLNRERAEGAGEGGGESGEEEEKGEDKFEGNEELGVGESALLWWDEVWFWTSDLRRTFTSVRVVFVSVFLLPGGGLRRRRHRRRRPSGRPRHPRHPLQSS